MKRSTWIVAVALIACAPQLQAQGKPVPSFRRTTVHYGKWLTAGAAVAFTAMAVHEHSFSRRDWDGLLAICRSSDNACERGGDGRYLRTDAEFLFQRSIYYDRRANRRLLGAQASLLVTAALFIIDMSGRNNEPDNIPFSPLRVSVEPSGAALVGLRLRF